MEASAEAAIRIEQVRDLEALEPYRDAWEALAREASAGLAQTYGYVAAGWRNRRAEAEQLQVLFAFVGGRLAAVWPLQVIRRGRLKAVCPVGSGSFEEYADLLLASDDPMAEPVARALHGVAVSLGDLLEVYNLPEESVLRSIVTADRRLFQTDAMMSPIISLAKHDNWEAWAARKSKNFRAKLRQDYKRLAERGPVVFHEVVADRAQAFCDWLFEEKARYLDRKSLASAWIRRPECKAFFAGLLGRPGSGVLGFSVEVGGRFVAGGICLVGPKPLMEYFVTTYDLGFEEGSPGKLLIEGMVRWCIERRIDFDFRLSREPYKLRWTDRDVPYFTHVIACTAAGVPYVLRRRFEAWSIPIRHRLKQALLRR